MKEVAQTSQPRGIILGPECPPRGRLDCLNRDSSGRVIEKSLNENHLRNRFCVESRLLFGAQGQLSCAVACNTHLQLRERCLQRVLQHRRWHDDGRFAGRPLALYRRCTALIRDQRLMRHPRRCFELLLDPSELLQTLLKPRVTDPAAAGATALVIIVSVPFTVLVLESASVDVWVPVPVPVPIPLPGPLSTFVLFSGPVAISLPILVSIMLSTDITVSVAVRIAIRISVSIEVRIMVLFVLLLVPPIRTCTVVVAAGAVVAAVVGGTVVGMLAPTMLVPRARLAMGLRAII